MTSVHRPFSQDLGELPSEFPDMNHLSAGVVFLMGCRSFQQYCCTYRSLLDWREFCPFCKTELERHGHKPTAVSGGWMLMPNKFPHRNTKQMWLLVPIRHVTDLARLTSADWTNIGSLLKVCGIRSGGIMFRFGDPHLNVGTIEHLHINLIEPVCGKEFRPPFAKEMLEHATDYQRMLGFRNELLKKGGRPWLFSETGISETQIAVT